MERSKLIISIIVGFAALLIVWRVGFYPPVPEQAEKPVETEVVGEAKELDEVQKLGDANEPKVVSDVNELKVAFDVNEPKMLAMLIKPQEPAEPNEPMEYVNLKDVQMKDIIQKLADWTDKVIIPSEESMKQKVTIYSSKELPRSEALAHIYSALRAKGYIAEHTDTTIYLKPIAEARLGEVPTVTADHPLAMLENKDQVVQKFFKLQNYSPSQMGEVILPLIDEYGYISADEATGSLLVIDTVKNLLRVEKIILQFDASATEETITEVFEINHGDPEEIVKLLETLLSDDGGSLRGSGRGGKPFGPGYRPSSSTLSKSTSKTPTKKPGSTGGTATSVSVGISRAPFVLIPETNYNWIIAKATPEDMELIREWIKKLDKSVPTIISDYPLARIENKNQVVQKFYKLQNYSPAQMAQVVGPLLSEEGYVSADESTGQLLVIDTVENLMLIEMIIAQFDVPEAEQAMTQIFEILHGDPSEIVQMLRMLLGESEGYSASRSRSRYDPRSRYGGSSYSRSSYGSSSRPGGYMGSRGSSGGGSSVVVGTSQFPIVLIPEPRRNWIIVRASAEDIKQIDEWITKLDMEEPVASEYEVVQLMYADPREVQNSVEDGFRDLPGTEFLPSILVQPLEETRQVIVFGRKDLREIVKKMIAEIDIPPGQFETKHFKLKYADPDEIKEKLDELFGETSMTSGSRYTSIYYFGSGGSRGGGPPSMDTVKVISYVSLKQVTVIASPDNIEEIAKQIEEWDAPLDVEALKPRIIELRNSDPVQMADLLRTLFSEEGGGGMSIYDILFGRGTEEKQKIVGPLYGQLTFEEVPGTKKIIVISKIPEAYDVVEALIRDLDKQEMAEVPRIVQLKYADPEDLSERLNAMFNEPGTSARIRVSAQGLAGDYSMEEDTQSSQQGGGGGTSGADQSTEDTYTPWWAGSGARSQIGEEMPISNVIGRIRFVPDPHSKSILVLAPIEFIDQIEQLIHDLDVPGKQVMVKAVVVEIDHKSMTSLGLQLASSTSAFGTLEENAITALNTLTHMSTHGSIAPSTGTAIGTIGTGTMLGAGADVYALLDFLVKNVNAKILNQQTLWTKDNEEASFFKGDIVAFQSEMGVTQQTTTQTYDYPEVGMTLAVRPSITPDKNVDMRVLVDLSQITSDLVNTQPVRSMMHTETNMIVQDAQTLMLGGILFQTDSVIKRKVPLFGDIPFVGGLFRHNETMLANNELIVFITPYVIDEPGEMLPETLKEIEGPRQKLEEVQDELQTKIGKMKNMMP